MTLQLVNDSMLEIKEYQGSPVVTFRDIDAVHKRTEGTAKRNFAENKHRFIETEDYFYVAADQKYEFRTFEIPNRGLILITESGYLMLAKSFTDDLAWKVQRMLVKNYFRTKVSAEERWPPATTADILKVNILTGKAFAAAMGLNEYQAVMAAINKTEQQTGDDLQEFKRLLSAGGAYPYVDGSGTRLTPERLAVLKALINAKRPLTPKQVAAITGRGRNAVQKLLIKLREAGAVTTIRFGQYVVPEQSQTGQ